MTSCCGGGCCPPRPSGLRYVGDSDEGRWYANGIEIHPTVDDLARMLDADKIENEDGTVTLQPRRRV